MTVGTWIDILEISNDTETSTSTSIYPLGNNQFVVTGYFDGSGNSFVESDGITMDSSGNSDIYIGKIDSSGTWLWATKAGGIQQDVGLSVVGLADGGCIVSGLFIDEAQFGNITVTSSGPTIFIGKVNSSGNWVWVEKIDGDGTYNNDYISEFYTLSMVLDGSNLIISGNYTQSLNFKGTILLSSSPNNNIFVASLNLDTRNWNWQLTTDSPGNGIYSTSIKLLGNSIFVLGYFKGTVVFETGNTQTSSGNSDIFVAKIVSESWSDIIIIGESSKTYTPYYFTQSHDDNLLLVGTKDMSSFLIKLDPFIETPIIFTKYIESTDNNYCISTSVVEVLNNIYVSGHYRNNLTIEGTTVTGNNKYNIFIAQYSTDGNYLTIKKATNTDGEIYSTSSAYSSNKENLMLTGYYKGTISLDNLTINTPDVINAYIVQLKLSSEFTPQSQVAAVLNSTSKQGSIIYRYDVKQFSGKKYIIANPTVGDNADPKYVNLGKPIIIVVEN